MNTAENNSCEMLNILRSLQVEVRELRDQLRGSSKPLLTVEEVAELIGRSAYTVRRWITQGDIRAERVHGTGPRGRLLVPRTEIAKLIDLGKGSGVPP